MQRLEKYRNVKETEGKWIYVKLNLQLVIKIDINCPLLLLKLPEMQISFHTHDGHQVEGSKEQIHLRNSFNEKKIIRRHQTLRK